MKTIPCLGYTGLLVLTVACAPTRQHLLVDPAATPQHRGELVVYRPHPTAIVYGFHVYFDSSYVGQTGPKGYLSWDVAPGKHLVRSECENFDELAVDVQPGETVYLKQRVRGGWLKPRTRLVQVDSLGASRHLSKMSPPMVFLQRSE